MNIFGTKKTVATILQGFAEMVKELDQVVTDQQAEADKQQQIINEAQAAKSGALAEVGRAKEAAGRISALIGSGI
jgi:predicted DNA binding CopG/RHH family protein